MLVNLSSFLRRFDQTKKKPMYKGVFYSIIYIYDIITSFQLSF